jgi:hypothetical protein
VVDNDGMHASMERSGMVTLGWGLHAIEVRYFEQAGGQELSVNWQGPGIVKAGIPDSMLFHGTGVTGISPKSSLTTTTSLSKRAIRIFATAHGIAVKAPAGSPWTLDLFTLDGSFSQRFPGHGIRMVPFEKCGRNFAVARLRSNDGETVERIVLSGYFLQR